jgi:heme/copper-type cytochrome/quinol oxidase subunit 2
MTTSAWWFMIIVWGVVIVNTLYCFWKLLNSSRGIDDSSE